MSTVQYLVGLITYTYSNNYKITKYYYNPLLCLKSCFKQYYNIITNKAKAG